MPNSIAPIVEGPSEVESLPILLRRILDQFGIYNIQVCRPFRVKRNRVVMEYEIEKAIKMVSMTRGEVGCILILLDADDDCPAELGPKLLQRCKSAIHLPVAVVMANKEFESWLLGAKESLRGVRGIRRDASPPPDPESIRGAKERLSANMAGQSYLEVDDQPALTQAMDINAAQQNCPSFAKLIRDLQSLINAMNSFSPLVH